MTNRMVQFLHPGPEHGWDHAITKTTGSKYWNRRCHKRKFMVADGLLTSDPNRQPVRGSFTFWGEWEPQSDAQLLESRPTSDHPKWLHTPQLRLDQIEASRAQGCDPCAPGGPQNTDPLVFGDRFLYVLCQQFRGKPPYTTQLVGLQKGDVILFGSCLGRQKFVLDAVLVIEISARLAHGGQLPNWESELHKRITMDLFRIPECGVTLYGGTTWRPGGPFSFVPCLPIEHAPRGFCRPVIEPVGDLSDVITCNFPQGFKVRSKDANSAWRAVVKQVLDQVDEPPDANFLSGNQLHSEASIAAADG